jgi:hypothetical protein
MKLPGVVRVKLKRQIVSRLGGGIVDADLKHRKTALQFERTLLGTFPGAELGLQATIDSRAKPFLGSSIVLVRMGIRKTVVVANVPPVVKVSLARPTSLFW